MLRTAPFCALLVLAISAQARAQSSMEAKRHFDAGLAAVRSASSEAGYESAIKEFEQAARLLPTWPEVFLNLGLLEEMVGRPGEAARSLRRYAKLAPQAFDASLRQRLGELEYRATKDGRVLPDIDARMPNGNPPLYNACFPGDLPAIELLLAKGASLEATNKYGRTALHAALWEKNRLLIDLLISRGANLNTKDVNGRSLLHNFAQERDTAALLLDKGAALEAKDSLGRTPFYDCIYSDRMESAEYLLSRGASVDTRDSNGWTPLWQAVNQSDASTPSDREKARAKIRFLLAKGANPNLHYYAGHTLLHDAVGKNQDDIVRMLVAAGADPNLGDTNGYLPLYNAVLDEKKELSELLLTLGAKLEAKTGSGETVLHMASRLGKTSMVEFLIAKGAQLEAKDGNGNTPLTLARIANKKETVALLIAKGASTKGTNLEAKDARGRTALLVACVEGEVADVDQLLGQGADLHARDTDGLTALHLAANVGTRKARLIAERLLAKGADVNAKDGKGTRPIGHALAFRHLAMAELLHANGAETTEKDRALFLPPDPKARGYMGKTWLHQAAADDEVELAERLIRMGAEVNAVTDSGWTPLQQAVMYKRIRMVEALLALGADPRCKGMLGGPLLHDADQPTLAARLIKAGADPNAKDDLGETALHRAASAGNTALIELLVASGARVDAPSQLGRPLHRAVAAGKKETVALLLRLGAQVNALDDNRQTPLGIARGRGFKEIEELLVNKGAK